MKDKTNALVKGKQCKRVEYLLHWVTVILWVVLVLQSQSLHAWAPIEVNPNTQSSPCNLLFHFTLEKQLEPTGYLFFSLSPFATTTKPTSCLVVSKSGALNVRQCVNLQEGSDAGKLSVNTSWVKLVNPNIKPSRTIAMQFSEALMPGQKYSVQVIMSNLLPAIGAVGAVTNSLEVYSISSTGFMLEENWNFGQVYFELRQNNNLNVYSVNALDKNLPGTSTSDLEFDITIGIQSPTKRSRLKFLLSDKFRFGASELTVHSLLTTPPTLLPVDVVSPNVILATFDNSFKPNDKFKVRVTEIQNPLAIANGFVSVYYLPWNSMSPLEISELSIPIATVPYAPIVTILTAEGRPPAPPMQFYQLKLQYLTATVVLPRQFDSNFVLQLSSDTLIIQKGTVFAKASNIQAKHLDYNHYSDKGVRISGFPDVAQGNIITITMQAWVPDTPYFKIFINIDSIQTVSTAAIIQAVSAAVDTVQGTDFINLLTDSQNQPNKLTKMRNSNSQLSFSVTSSFTTQVSSSLKVYTNNNMFKSTAFTNSGSCLVNTQPQPCTLELMDQNISVLTIKSNPSTNLFPINTQVNILVKDLSYRYASSVTEHIYQFYFQLTASEQILNPLIKSTMLSPQVIPQRHQMMGLHSYFLNNVFNSGNNFPNIFRLVSQTPDDWNYVIQATQSRLLTIFCQQGWTNLLTGLVSGDAYPCMSSEAVVSCTFIQGSTSHISEDYPLSWDRIEIVLPGMETSKKFSIALPTTFTSVEHLARFQVMAGIYNRDTRLITHVHALERPISNSETYCSLDPTVSVGSKPKRESRLELSGRAGSYKDQVELIVDPATSNFASPSYVSALIITSQWKWFEESSSYSTKNVANVGANEQKPLSVMLGAGWYLTLIPIQRSSGELFSIWLNGVKLPYSHHLPYYSVSVVDSSGTIDSYNEFINQEAVAFYSSPLLQLAFSCSDPSLGVANTDCSFAFTPHQQIDVAARLSLQFSGLLISTQLCILIRDVDQEQIPVQCSSSTDKSKVTVAIQAKERQPGGSGYTLRLYGVAIEADTIVHWASLSVQDASGGYVIQQGTRVLLTTIRSQVPLSIDQVSFWKNNPVVVSALTVLFRPPRPLAADEIFAVVLSNDFSSLNSVSSKLHIQLYEISNTGDTLVPNLRWFLSPKNSQLQFEGLRDVLYASQFRLEIFGIKTPSTVEQDLVSLIYLRVQDSSYSVQNVDSSTAAFPQLVDKVSSLISMQSFFNTEGLEQPLQFKITCQHAQVDASTVWYLTMPRYYSQQLWNQPHLAYCRIDGIRINCNRHPDLPYTILLSGSPKAFSLGSTYTLEIFGLPCPRMEYTNGNSQYVTESIFLGIASSKEATSYSEYSELFLTENVISPQQNSNYGSLTLRQTSSSNSQTGKTTFFSARIHTSIDIISGDWLYLTFPKVFDNFNDLPMEGQMVYGSTQKSITATVANTRIGFEMPAGVAAGDLFSVELSSLPTFMNAADVDMNEMQLTLASPNRLQTKACSLQLHNQAASLQFEDSELHLVINNYSPIQVTAGTWSDLVTIRGSDSGPFLSNVEVQFDSQQIKFNPNPTHLLLGSLAEEFQIGVEQSLIPTIYTFGITKRETSINAFYTSLSWYPVRVSNLPVTISVPSYLNVPKGGCSVPVELTVPKRPFSDVSLRFEYDSAAYPLDQFWVNEQISYNQLAFTKKITSRWLSFCTSADFSVPNFNVNIYVRGTNQGAYRLSSPTIAINMISNLQTNKAPQLQLTTSNIQKTFVQFSLTTNLDGHIFYQLALSPLKTPLNILELKFEIKQKNLTIQSQSDYLTRIYTKDRDHRLGLAAVQKGLNRLTFDDLLPERDYTICMFFENQHRALTERVCDSIRTQNWGRITRFSIDFNRPIFESELNRLMCFFSKASESKISQVVDLEGKSCSLSSTASNYHFSYPGSTYTKQLSSTILYHISDRNLTTDPSDSAFSEMYDSNELTDSARALALSTFSIDYINNSMSLGEFSPTEAIKMSSREFQPSITFNTQSYSASSFSLYLRNMKLTHPGSVYIILTEHKSIQIDEIAGHADVEIRPIVVPTKEQILNCQDGYGQIPAACKRMVLKDGESIDLQFQDVYQNRVYAMFYIVTNQYPLRPIVFGQVRTHQLATLVNFADALICYIGYFALIGSIILLT